jgi:hypothetical protein
LLHLLLDLKINYACASGIRKDYIFLPLPSQKEACLHSPADLNTDSALIGEKGLENLQFFSCLLI